MNETQKTLLALTSASLFDKTISIPDNTDWKAVFDEVKKHNIVSLTYPVVKQLNIPTNILQSWENKKDQYLLNNAKNISCHLDLHKLLKESDIPYVILKGVASGSYYPNYLLRGYGDIDFLVKPDDFNRTADLLNKNGFTYIEESKKHKVFNKNNMIYELHDEPLQTPSNKLQNEYDGFFFDIIDKAVSFKHNNSICMIPSDRHNAVILLAHSAIHIAESGIGIRHLLDWAVFANKVGNDFFIQMKDTLKQMGLWRFCKILTALCTKYVGLKEFDWATDIDPKYLEDLIEDILKYGEFGNAYKNTDNESTPINNYRQKDLTKSFLTLLNKKAKKLTLIKKIPILLPFGWIYVLLQYAVKVLTGKSRIKNVKTNIEKRAEKNQILEQWNLFEKEE